VGPMSTSGAPEIAVRPAMPADWPDVERVFRDCADAARCWCAFWYLPNRDFKAGWGDGNRHVLRDRVEAGLQPGVLAYAAAASGTMPGTEPVGWAGVAPRADYDRLRRSRPLAPVDDRPAWAITCFIVRRAWRRRGLMRPLLRGALAHALAQGATAVEAYPVESGRPSHWDLFLGSPAAFREAGFVEVARRLPRRPILRFTATPGPPPDP
jgi:GNAT superfamily N-acetyltransferase